MCGAGVRVFSSRHACRYSGSGWSPQGRHWLEARHAGQSGDAGHSYPDPEGCSALRHPFDVHCEHTEGDSFGCDSDPSVLYRHTHQAAWT